MLPFSMRLAASLALLSREATNVIREGLKLISFGIKSTSCLSPPILSQVYLAHALCTYG